MGPRGWRRSRSPGVGIGCVPALAAALSAHLRLSAWRLDTAFCVSEVLIFKFEIHDLISGRPGSSPYRGTVVYSVYTRGTRQPSRLTSATTPVTVLTLTVVVGGQSGQSSGATRRAGRSSNRNANARVLRRAPRVGRRRLRAGRAVTIAWDNRNRLIK
jgi:hypothetical protein